MREKYWLWESMPEGERPKEWIELVCPMVHPPTRVQRARRGDQAAAAEVVRQFETYGITVWNGAGLEEMRELAAGDTEATKRRRREQATVRSRYSRHPERYRRWLVALDIEVRAGFNHSSLRRFTSQDEAIAWARSLVNNRKALEAFLAEISDEHRTYRMGPDTQVRTLEVTLERLTYPWHWPNGRELWVPERREWRWESEPHQALVAELAAKR
ncbi:MAG TPA: hypothetical protein VLI05_03460 [Candidatus Saccharimonadia bacterium]|nr:hypothetical protein [Candidatus Saccharimonadia bacterium]